MNPALSVAANLSQGDDDVLFYLPVTKKLAISADTGLGTALPQLRR